MIQRTLNFDMEWPVASAPPDTSEKAAKDMKSRAPLLRERTLEQISNSTGLTADEIAANLGESILSIRPRVSELAKRGVVIKTDRTRRNHSGKAAIVWRAR